MRTMRNTANAFCQVRYCLIVGVFYCLLIWFILFAQGFSSHSRIFHNWRSHHYRWRVQNLTYVLHSRPLSCEGCHIYSDMGRSLIWSSPRTRDTHTCCRAFGTGAFTICFNNGRLLPPVVEPVSRACEANALPTESPRYFFILTSCIHRCNNWYMYILIYFSVYFIQNLIFIMNII